jgi:hypothetical protein
MTMLIMLCCWLCSGDVFASDSADRAKFEATYLLLRAGKHLCLSFVALALEIMTANLRRRTVMRLVAPSTRSVISIPSIFSKLIYHLRATTP